MHGKETICVNELVFFVSVDRAGKGEQSVLRGVLEEPRGECNGDDAGDGHGNGFPRPRG